MNKISEALHEEFHKAEKRVWKRFGKMTQEDRALGMIAYLSCVAVETHLKGDEE